MLVAKLIARTPCAEILPKTIGTVTLSEVDAGRVTLVAPFKGQEKAVSDALKEALGLAFPAPNRTSGKGPRAIWYGMGQALVLGVDVPNLAGAACVDHSDAWAIVRLDGNDAEAVLARLTPIDLRARNFKRGHTARTLVGHMTVSVTRLGATSFEIMGMRSMAATLVHELSRAATNVSARTAQ